MRPNRRDILMSIVFLILLSQIPLISQCKFRKLSVSFYHVLAIGIDGSLWAWGNNDWGQLGDGSFQNKTKPIKIGNDTTWRTILSVENKSFAIKADGSLWVWGNNTDGVLGLGNYITVGVPTRIGSDKWINISSSGYCTWALRSDGSLYFWGCEYTNGKPNISPVFFSSFADWKSITVIEEGGGAAKFGIRNDGSLWSWGRNTNGLLGLGISKDTLIAQPVRIGNDNNWSFISGYFGYALGLKTDSTLWSWGDNIDGQLGNQQYYVFSNSPKIVDKKLKFIDFSTTYSTVLAISNYNQIWMWGKLYGELRKDTMTRSNYPLLFDSSTIWKEAFSGYGGSVYSTALKKDSSVWIKNQGKKFANICCVPTSTSNEIFTCPKDTIFYKGKAYYKGGPQISDTLQSVSGCDSVANITIQNYKADTGLIRRTLCYNDMVLIGNKYYSRNDTSGYYIIPKVSFHGCDSINKVSLHFNNDIEINSSVSNYKDSVKIDLQITGGQPPYSYLWSNGATTSSITGVVNRTYKVTVTDDLNCTKDDSFVIVATGSDSNFTGDFHWELINKQLLLNSPDAMIVELNIFDLMGRKICSQSLHDQKFSFVLPELQSDLYIVQIRYNGGIYKTFKLVLKD